MRNNFYRLIFIFTALVILSGESRVHLNPVPHVTQAINVSGDAIYIEINIVNNSTDSIFLEKVIPVRERTMGPEFTIISNKSELAFVGAMAKRRPYQKSDFFELKSGESESLKVRIDLDYQFIKGNHKYDIFYIYLMYNPVAEEMIVSSSPSASFEYLKIF